ncbi:chaperonin 10-like protein [Cenococcum geophilum]
MPANYSGILLSCVYHALTLYTYLHFTATDVDIRVTHCGICGSDIYTLRSGWAPTKYSVCVGHEIVGRITRRPDCDECSAGQENHCAKQFVGTCNGVFGNGSRSYGGYSERVCVPAHFVVKIPDALSSAAAAPTLCSGITVYAPLKKNGAGPRMRVKIRVVAISRTAAKKQDALAMGVDVFIAMDEDEAWNRKYSRSLDLFVQSLVWSLPPKLSASTQLYSLQSY